MVTIEALRNSISKWLGLDVVDEQALAVFKALGRNISPIVQSFKTRLLQSAFCRWADGVCQGRIKAAGTSGSGARFAAIFSNENGLPVAEDLLISRLFPKNIVMACALSVVECYKTKAAVRKLFIDRLGDNGKWLGDSVYSLGKYAQAITEYTEQPGRKASTTVDLSVFEIVPMPMPKGLSKAERKAVGLD